VTREDRSGLIAGFAAFGTWGLIPVYWKLFNYIPASEILAHRFVWTTLFLVGLLSWQRRWPEVREAIQSRRALLYCLASGLAISVNWFVFIWAVNVGRVIETSLGYFMTPLINVALGYFVLGERPRRAQWIALAIAATGVAWLTASTGRLPWIGLVLGLSFGAYGLLRKVASLGALEGLTLETIILAPAAIVGMAIWWRSTATSFPGPDATTNAWLIGLGPATTLPLLLFAVAARRLSMTTLGLFQYLSPTIQFLLGVWLFREPFGSARFAGFVLIWIALALYSLDGWRRRTTRVVAAEG